MFMFLSLVFSVVFFVMPYIVIVAVLTIISMGLGLKPESEWDMNRRENKL